MSNPQWPHVLTAEDRRRGAQAANAARISPEAIVQRALRLISRAMREEVPESQLRAAQIALSILYKDARPQNKQRGVSDRLLEKIATLGPHPQIPSDPAPPADMDDIGTAAE